MKTILVCLCSAILAGLPVFSQEERPKPPRDQNPEKRAEIHRERKGHRPPRENAAAFQRMDTDGDHLISKREFAQLPRLSRLQEAKRNEIFSRLDKDADGNLTKSEVQQMLRGGDPRKIDFKRLDTNKSGGLDFCEFSQGNFFKKLPEKKRRQIFKRLDPDGNREISPKDQPERLRREKKAR